MTAFPWATNLVGPNFVLSSVAPTTQQGGKATLVNSLQWSRFYSGGASSHDNAAYAAATWGDGGVVVSGPSYRIGSDSDFATVCYGADGTAFWTNRYDGPVHGYDVARFLATSATGETWVAGESQRGSSFFPQDIVVIKYASNGVPAWTNRFASYETNSSYPWGLTVDASGNAYVTESAVAWAAGGIGTLVGEAITKVDPLGNVMWAKLYPANGPDSGESIHRPGPMALDDAGDLIVAGESGRPHYTTGTSIMKFAGDGTAVWTNHRPAAIGFVRTLNLDRWGDAILSGDRWSGNFTAYEIVKCSSGGTTLWTNAVAGPRYQGGSVPQAIPDAYGDIYFIGGSPEVGHESGLYQILKLSSSGVPLWTNQFVRFGVTNGTFLSADVDNDGNLYLLGNAMAPGRADTDVVILKYSGAGLPVWTNRFDGAGFSDVAYTLTVSQDGSIYASGRSGTTASRSDFVTLKYADSLVYTPRADFTGLDTLACTLTDTFGNRATGAVEVLVLSGMFRFDLSPTATRLTAAGLHLQLSGLPGTNAVVLETSPDLISWQRIRTNAPAGNSVEFLDPSALTLPRRYYRASQQP